MGGQEGGSAQLCHKGGRLMLKVYNKTQLLHIFIWQYWQKIIQMLKWTHKSFIKLKRRN